MTSIKDNCQHIVASDDTYFVTLSDYLQGIYDPGTIVRYETCPRCREKINWKDIEKAIQKLKSGDWT